MTGATPNAIVWLLKIASTMMLFAVILSDTCLLIAWFGSGFIESEWSKFPLWIIFTAALFSFVQFLISSFLYGVVHQVVTTGSAAASDDSLGQRLSDTIDDGWFTCLKVARICAALVAALIVIVVAIFFNDLRFLIGVHRGMELSASATPKDAQKWFRLSVDSAGADRIAVARFLYAGSLMRAREYAAAEQELLKCTGELDVKNEEHQALLVYVYSALSNCYLYQNNLVDGEKWAANAIKVIEDNPNLIGLRFRVIGSYKQFLIPEAPPLAVAISGLNDIYVRQGKFDLALQTFGRILKALDARADLKIYDIEKELYRFHSQLAEVKSRDESIFQKAIAMSADLAVKRCGIKNATDFGTTYSSFVQTKHRTSDDTKH